MNELKDALGFLYVKFGGDNKVVQAFSEYVDEIIAKEQRDRLEKENDNKGRILKCL